MSSYLGVMMLEHDPTLEFQVWGNIDLPMEVEETVWLRPFCSPDRFGVPLLEFLHCFDYGLLLVTISECLLEIPEEIPLLSHGH